MLINKLIIGIDPDVSKSGYCEIMLNGTDIQLQHGAYSFPEIVIEIFKRIAEHKKLSQYHCDIEIYVEAGWLNRPHNFHTPSYAKKSISDTVANGVGRNEETGRKIIEMAKYYGLNVFEAPPLKKIWGADHRQKISHEELKNLTGGLVKGQTNQDTRDAILLAWDKAGLPMRIKMNSNILNKIKIK